MTVKLNFRPYIRRYTSPNENFEYSYPLILRKINLLNWPYALRYIRTASCYCKDNAVVATAATTFRLSKTLFTVCFSFVHLVLNFLSNVFQLLRICIIQGISYTHGWGGGGVGMGLGALFVLAKKM